MLIKLSRQRLWQLRKEKEGRCTRCGKEKSNKSILCPGCSIKHRIYNRKIKGITEKTKSTRGRKIIYE